MQLYRSQFQALDSHFITFNFSSFLILHRQQWMNIEKFINLSLKFKCCTVLQNAILYHTVVLAAENERLTGNVQPGFALEYF